MATRSVSMATYWALASILACAGVVAGDETPTDFDTGMDDEVDCAALAGNLNEAFSSRADSVNWNSVGTDYAAVYRMFDVVVEHICPGAPRASCGGLGCPPDLRQGEPVPQGL